MDNLPKNWALSTIEETIEILDSKRKPVSASERAKRIGDIPYYGATGVAGKIDDYIFDEELVLLGEDGAPFFDLTKNVAYLITGKSWVNNHAHVLRAKSNITTNTFLLHYLNQFDYSNYVGGTTRLKLNQGNLKLIPFPLPPLPEQQRIVAKLNVLFGHLEHLKERLDLIPNLLKEFKQSVLTQAVTGKLTQEWRKGKELEEWSKTILDNVCKITMGQSPPGSSYNNIGDGVPLVNGPVEFGGKDPFSKTKKIKYTTKPTKFCEVNDLLICVRGSTTGRLNIAGFRSCIGRGVASIRAERISQKYVNVFMSLQYNKILQSGTGTTFPSISGDFIKKFKITYPKSQIEQEEVVFRVEILFANLDAIEERYTSLKAKIEALPQAILHKAFKGELVEQLATDGNAADLLEEIKKLKTELGKKKPVKKKLSMKNK